MLDRVFDILDVLAEGATTPSDISARLGLHRSTVFRLLANLADHGYAVKDEGAGTYGLGMKLFYLGGRAIQERVPVQRLHSGLDRLAHDTGCTAQLWMRDGRQAVCIDQVESPADLRVIGRIGRRFPLYAGAAGKTLLAFAPASVSDDVLAGPLEALSDRTTTDPQELREQLADIRRRRSAVQAGENPVVDKVVAAPIFDAQDEVRVAVVILVARDGQQRVAISQARETVRAAAEQMSSVLGGRSH